MAKGEVDSLEQPRTPVPPEAASQQGDCISDGNPEVPKWDVLCQQARSGSQSAIGQLLDQCRGYLTVIANQEIGQQIRVKVAPSDIVQESLLDAYRDFDKFEGTTEQELLKWLRRVLLNNLSDAVKRYRIAASRSVDRERSLTADDNSKGLVPDLVANTSLPLAKAIRGEEQQRVLAAIRQLPERQRQAVILRNLEGKPFEEIGQALQISAEAARKLWERAIQRLSEELSPDDNSSLRS